MLQCGYLSVLQAQSRDQFHDEVVRFTSQLGFDRVSALTVVDQAAGSTEFIQIHNTPDSLSWFTSDRQKARIDPVMQHCKRNSVPFIWNQSTYVNASMGENWEILAPYGYKTGISLALHLPEGRHFALSVMRDDPLPSDPVAITRLLADVQLFAVYAQEAAFKVLLPTLLQPDRPSLTPRELETLRWTMEGKTAWEVGAILGISERTAVLHVNNAMHKLGCVNKHQAVLKALRLGLIH